MLRGGGKIHPHYGPTNFRLRLQYPLTLNPGCRLYCRDQVSSYEHGYAIIDDSYAHWAENPQLEGESRIMLVVDIWHPGITPEERIAMESLLATHLK